MLLQNEVWIIWRKRVNLIFGGGTVIAAYHTILISLVVSTLFSIWLFKKKGNKWLGVLIGFCINTLLLSVATIIFYKVYNVKEVEGLFSNLGIFVFVFFIPIITCINFYILEFVKSKNILSNN